MNNWDHTTRPSLAAAAVLRILAHGPMPSTELRRRLVEAGHSRTAAKLAITVLRGRGAITVKRHGSRTSPFTATLAPGGEHPE